MENKISAVNTSNNLSSETTTTRKHPFNDMFPFMGLGSFIYAFFYTLFLYQNSAGITYPFFVGGTCLFFFFFLKKSGITAKKDVPFYVAALMLLSVSTCMTDSFPLLFFNKLGIFLLFFCMLLHCFYDDKKWDFGKYLCSVCNLVFVSFAFIMNPFFDLADYYREHKAKAKDSPKKNGIGGSVFYGILIALPLLLVILILLSSADAVFAGLFDSMFDFFSYLPSRIHLSGSLFLFLFAFFASYCLMARLKVRDIKEEITDARTKDPVIAITFTTIISLVYLIFCLIQIVYLFAGKGTLPAGYTYAGYARQGFFQLVFVCLLNLSLVLICIKYFKAHPALKITLTFISGCTYIMLASSAYRMLLYISVYQLTFLRIFVLWALLVILLLMVGVTVMIYRESFPYFRYAVITVTTLYLLFSFSHPDYWIAKYNISHYTDNNYYHTEISEENENRDTIIFDRYYMKRLSADAAPVIYSMAEEIGYDNDSWFKDYAFHIWYDNHHGKLTEKSNEQLSVRKWNLSRWRAEHYYEASSFNFS